MSPGAPPWQGRSIASSKLRMLEFSAFLEQPQDPETVSIQDWRQLCSIHDLGGFLPHKHKFILFLCGSLSELQNRFHHSILMLHIRGKVYTTELEKLMSINTDLKIRKYIINKKYNSSTKNLRTQMSCQIYDTLD